MDTSSFVVVFMLASSCTAILTNRTGDVLDVFVTHSDWEQEPQVPATDKCAVRLLKSLEKLRRRQTQQRSSALIDLSGYALHQPLTNAPFDMYVTDIRVRTPAVGNWARVQKCHYTPIDHRVVTKILFNDLTVSGSVKLYEENIVLKHPLSPSPSDNCNMTLRLRRAGIGIDIAPARGRLSGTNTEIRTQTKFVDPNFVSIHAYGCKLNQILKTTDRNSRKMGNTEAIQPRTAKYNTIQKRYDSLENWNKANNESKLEIITLENPDSKTINLNQWNQQKLTTMLNVQNAIHQQANTLFQQHGPFSNQRPTGTPPILEQHGLFSNQRPTGTPPILEQHGLFSKPKPNQNYKPIGTITELDQNLKPIRPEPVFSTDKIVNYQNAVEDVSKEMEDVFLRGVKTLLAKYLEKQLEIPLKEALMSKIGYTISYG